jgi:hypothetical protein
MAYADKLTPAEAVEFAEEEHSISVEISTIRIWCTKYNIGIKIGGRLFINKKRLIWILEGKQWKITQEERDLKKTKKK